jgi:hypothetical protein
MATSPAPARAGRDGMKGCYVNGRVFKKYQKHDPQIVLGAIEMIKQHAFSIKRKDKDFAASLFIVANAAVEGLAIRKQRDRLVKHVNGLHKKKKS